jgi:proteasome lid subunit RPN8/RPN11
VATILLTEDAARDMVDAAREAHPHETGGVLLGVRAGRRPWVVSAAHVPSADPSPSRYSLPKGATTPLVDAAREHDKRIGYLGEWHSHPYGRGPSSDDRAMMRALAWFLPFPQPILLIVARQNGHYVLRGYASRVLLLVGAEIVTTGPLSVH